MQCVQAAYHPDVGDLQVLRGLVYAVPLSGLLWALLAACVLLVTGW